VNEKVKVIGAKAPKGRMGAPEEITSSVDFWPTMIPVLFFDRSFSSREKLRTLYLFEDSKKNFLLKNKKR
jgi:hypothetical protein